MYVYNTESMSEDIINTILNSNLVVGIRRDGDFLLSKEFSEHDKSKAFEQNSLKA